MEGVYLKHMQQIESGLTAVQGPFTAYDFDAPGENHYYEVVNASGNFAET